MRHFHATANSELKSRKFCPSTKLLQLGAKVQPYLPIWSVSAHDEGSTYDCSGKSSIWLVFSIVNSLKRHWKRIYFRLESYGGAHESIIVPIVYKKHHDSFVNNAVAPTQTSDKQTWQFTRADTGTEPPTDRSSDKLNFPVIV
jgi:hypothetical protein